MSVFDLGHVDPGTYQWTWDGRRRDGSLVREGRYILEVVGSTDAGEYYLDVRSARRFDVRYSVDSVERRDRIQESGTHHVDLSSVALINGPR